MADAGEMLRVSENNWIDFAACCMGWESLTTQHALEHFALHRIATLHCMFFCRGTMKTQNLRGPRTCSTNSTTRKAVTRTRIRPTDDEVQPHPNSIEHARQKKTKWRGDNGPTQRMRRPGARVNRPRNTEAMTLLTSAIEATPQLYMMCATTLHTTQYHTAFVNARATSSGGRHSRDHMNMFGPCRPPQHGTGGQGARDNGAEQLMPIIVAATCPAHEPANLGARAETAAM